MNHGFEYLAWWRAVTWSTHRSVQVVVRVIQRHSVWEQLLMVWNGWPVINWDRLPNRRASSFQLQCPSGPGWSSCDYVPGSHSSHPMFRSRYRSVPERTRFQMALKELWLDLMWRLFSVLFVQARWQVRHWVSAHLPAGTWVCVQNWIQLSAAWFCSQLSQDRAGDIPR